MAPASGCQPAVKKVADVLATHGVIQMVIAFKVVSSVQYHHHAVARMRSTPTVPVPVAKPIAIAGHVLKNTAWKVVLVLLVLFE